MSAKDELYNIQQVKYYQMMGYCGLRVQPFEVFRDAYIFAGGYSWNWQLRSIMERLEQDTIRINTALRYLHTIGWRATVFQPRMDDVCFINVGRHDDVSDVSDSSTSGSDASDSESDTSDEEIERMWQGHP